MKTAGIALILLGTLIIPAAASAQPRRGSQGVPPGHLPPPGECRVWYANRPAGRQPPPTDCRSAERLARQSRNARVIYGDYRDERPYRDGDRRRDEWGRDRGRDDGRVYPERYPQDRGYPGEYRNQHPGWEAGYRDGLVKGREDVSKNRSYDPTRHQWYRSASRGYDRGYGLRGEYSNIYRDGFEAGYAEEFRYRR